MTPRTLIELLDASRNTDRGITYLDSEQDSRTVSFDQLHGRALGILHHLQQLGARPGDQVILFLQRNEAFIDGFWAAILGGLIPVPVAVGISDEHRHKLLRIAAKLGNPLIFTERKTFDRISSFATEVGAGATFEALRNRAFIIEQLDDITTPGKIFTAKPEDTAFIQFSSGSTSDPKGIVLTHANLIANWQGAAAAARFSRDDISLSWMPLTHDMGLIGMHIFMLGSQMQLHQMPTELFVRRPLLWLQFASSRRATILCSPNFGYRHYLKVLGDRPIEGLDLTAVRIIFNGAEPISATLCEEFLARLAPARLARRAMFPVYGLAEASVAVSFPDPASELLTLHLDRHQMSVGQQAAPIPADAPDALSLVSVGRAIPNCEVRIAAADDTPLTDNVFGHLQIRGGNVTSGYFEEPDANARLVTSDGWLRTGDLALQRNGALYITGRAKEILFVNGQNYYPHDLESIAIHADGMELGKLVVSGVRRPRAQTDELVVFALHRKDLADFVPVATQIARLINEHTGLEVAEVVPVNRIPKTTSGKIQRHLLEQDYIEGIYDAELRELARLRDSLRAPAAKGQSEIERKLATICESVMGESAMGGRRIGVTDNLFELGASSLKLIEIHEQIDREYPNQIDLTELFDYPTITELAAHLDAKLGASPSTAGA